MFPQIQFGGNGVLEKVFRGIVIYNTDSSFNCDANDCSTSGLLEENVSAKIEA